MAEAVEKLFPTVGDAAMIQDRPHFGNKNSCATSY
jgi:hypothetical protein